MKKSDAPLNVKYLQSLVECLCMLGKVAAAGAMIWYDFVFICYNNWLIMGLVAYLFLHLCEEILCL